MTHVDNLDSIFRKGLQAHNNPHKKRDISNQNVNARREVRENIYGKKIHDYVPFYFNPRNAMIYKNRFENIVVLAFSKTLMLEENILFTDKNASSNTVHFYNKIDDLDKINWANVQRSSWCNVSNTYEVKQTMMAEVLVPKSVSMKYLKGIYCKNTKTKTMLMKKYNLPSRYIVVKPDMFFN